MFLVSLYPATCLYLNLQTCENPVTDLSYRIVAGRIFACSTVYLLHSQQPVEGLLQTCLSTVQMNRTVAGLFINSLDLGMVLFLSQACRILFL